MLLDCMTCPGHGLACDGCVVAAVLDPTPAMPSDVAAAVTLLRRTGLIGPVHLALVAEDAGDGPRAASPLPLAGRAQRRAG